MNGPLTTVDPLRPPASRPAPVEPTSVSPMVVVWRLLRWPWLLVFVGGLTLLFLALARFFPQLPGQYGIDPTGAARWFLIATEESGPFGSLLRDLGLFDFRHSLLLRALLSGLGFLLLIHLADLVDGVRFVAQFPKQITQPLPEPGAPLPLTVALPLYRSRQVISEAPEVVATDLTAWLTHQGIPVTLTTASFAQEVAGHEAAKEEAPEKAADSDPEMELRLWSLRNSWTLFLRLVAVVGMLLGLVGMGVSAQLGWALAVENLVPGSSFHFDLYQISLRYDIDGLTQGQSPHLVVAAGTESADLTLTERRSLRVNGVTVDVQLSVPGMAVLAEIPVLALAGKPQRQTQLGLLFPGPGSEELVTLPAQEMALRIIRLPDGQNGYLIELFAGGDVQPSQRLEIRDGTPTVIDLGQDGLSLTLAPTPSVQVQVRSHTGEWLLWLGFILLVMGAVGFVRPFTLLLVQVAAWPMGRAVVVVQSNLQELLHAAQTRRENP